MYAKENQVGMIIETIPFDSVLLYVPKIILNLICIFFDLINNKLNHQRNSDVAYSW